MNIYLAQDIRIKHSLNTCKQTYKEYESMLIPHKGDFINDSAFRDAQEVEMVVLDLERNACHVHLKAVELANHDEKAIEDYIDLYKLHGWKSYPDC
ncbi:hypothetical protein NLX67_04950 [Domibacillus sp. A3M-37]|jgi:hypothetical protein|uniref:hypothetical protein n=2 Tax=Domibacillus TaxID=1433999 RepID=UPI0020B769F5|nr:hypothetical protein [Domibacillus sp. A3M-37]MCP3761730.1 hypothetical protein [Domibacillus sp. A3M-37]